MVEHAAFKQYPNIQNIITPKLDELSQCYNLQMGNEIIAKSKNCDPQKFTAQAKIVLPYQPDKKIILLNLTID